MCSYLLGYTKLSSIETFRPLSIRVSLCDPFGSLYAQVDSIESEEPFRNLLGSFKHNIELWLG